MPVKVQIDGRRKLKFRCIRSYSGYHIYINHFRFICPRLFPAPAPVSLGNMPCQCPFVSKTKRHIPIHQYRRRKKKREEKA